MFEIFHQSQGLEQKPVGNRTHAHGNSQISLHMAQNPKRTPRVISNEVCPAPASQSSRVYAKIRLNHFSQSAF